MIDTSKQDRERAKLLIMEVRDIVKCIPNIKSHEREQEAINRLDEIKSELEEIKRRMNG